MSAKFSKELKKELLIVFAGALLLALSWIWDEEIFRFITSLHSQILDILLSWVSSYTTVAFVMLVMTALFLYENKKSKWIIPLAISFAFSSLLAFLLKSIIQRPRPDGLVMFIPFTRIIDYSFPSGHSASAFSTLPILGKNFRHIRIFWTLFAATVAFSRIYSRVHYPSDIVAGALLGYLFGLFVLKLAEALSKKKAAVR